MSEQPRIIVDHIRGRRRGRRLVFPAGARVRFGRHPDSEVAFHPRRDLDASSRHAELCPVPGRDGYVLRDVGSSNGTFADGHEVDELSVLRGRPVVIEFGPAGPAVRVFVGAEADAPAPVPGGLAAAAEFLRAHPRLVLALAGLFALVAAVAWGWLV
ncbi:FHA domain-containing protein [Haliangium sp.]|uniref:FHA domain-containing protein n=1 Tax=Haliangium sp. TaxID=2663208 RepID=UPI003D14A869